MNEENPFEDSLIAQEWITSIESPQSRSREQEFYPLLYTWTHELQPKTIVEIGSGQGVCSSKIDSTRSSYVGIEPSEHLLSRARQLYPEENKTFLKGDAYRVPLPDGSAEAVFSVGVWFHVRDLDAAHRELARIVVSGGEVLILTANADTRKLWESWFEHPVIEGKRIVGKVAVPGGTLSKNIFYFHTQQEIVASLEAHGFTIMSVTQMGFGGGSRREGTWIAVRAKKTMHS